MRFAGASAAQLQDMLSPPRIVGDRQFRRPPIFRRGLERNMESAFRARNQDAGAIIRLREIRGIISLDRKPGKDQRRGAPIFQSRPAHGGVPHMNGFELQFVRIEIGARIDHACGQEHLLRNG